ncbi:Binding-protein-dependent transport systems inner membrane component [uncultured Sporomusa sp.]|uniref:Binding-protein-dependent transport systems inner membrane component n=1 Tax=uncultured Sporomusa sp. TaxID=307249 RepID=A0A212M0J3_9FIRM|nr:ABC transporter permease subunit [uncultured Sporomusa sp.]SCM83247.1 Binding-protein-dependent transport systems inner membrane component [uncultured Sporomusa sp.]
MESFKSNRVLLAGICLVVFFCLLAVLAQVIAPHDPYRIDLPNKLAMPDAFYPLGTDILGRCVLSRLVYGAQTTLLGSSFIVLSISALGLLLGIVAGYNNAWTGRLLSVVMDIFLAIPELVWMLAIVGLWGIDFSNLLLALVLSHWAVYARVTRNMVWEISRQNYVLAAKTLNTSRLKILTRHLMPNIFPRLLVLITLDMGKFILAIAGFSFLGLGVQPPLAEWGAMLSEGKGFIEDNPQLIMAPGFCIVALVTGFTLVGEGLRDCLDPRQWQGK